MTVKSGARKSGGETIALDRDSPIPLYLQIKLYLSRQIAVWEQHNDKFYTTASCATCSARRMTVRQAVQELVDDALLKRARGIGTFVVARKIEERLTPQMNFPELWVESGRPVRLEVLTYDTRPCPPSFAEDLGIASAAPCATSTGCAPPAPCRSPSTHPLRPARGPFGDLTQADAASSIPAHLLGTISR